MAQTRFAPLLFTIHRPHISSTLTVGQFVLAQMSPLAAFAGLSRWSTLPTSRRSRPTPNEIRCASAVAIVAVATTTAARASTALTPSTTHAGHPRSRGAAVATTMAFFGSMLCRWSAPRGRFVAEGGLLILVAQHSTFRRNSGINSNMTNIVSGRQLRAARVLAGLTQAELATESGFNPRAAKYWERRENELPTSVPDTLAAIERTLRRHGVEVFERPTPGARLIEITSSGHN
jgi:hypothetical protein